MTIQLVLRPSNARMYGVPLGDSQLRSRSRHCQEYLIAEEILVPIYSCAHNYTLQYCNAHASDSAQLLRPFTDQ